MMSHDPGGTLHAGPTSHARPEAAAGAPEPQKRVSGDAYFDVIAEVSRFFAHGLGNMLTGLNLTLDMLEAGKPGDPRQQMLLQRALQMMERLCAFKESWSGLGDDGNRRFAMCEPEPLVQNALAQARLGSEYTVDVTCPPQTPPFYCHVDLLAGALQYLLRNAVDAMPQGGHLGIDVHADGSSTKVTVWDSGPGMPVELQSKIFYEPVTTKPYGGGIGLMLVAMIARRVHRGEVRWAPRTPQGCSIELELPTCDGSVARIVP